MTNTKIVATVGPSSDSIETMISLIQSGVNIFRFNLKHNTQSWHGERISRAEKASKKAGKRVGILLDFQGPEIRIGTFREDFLTLSKGETVCFVTGKGTVGSGKEIVINNLELLQKLPKGQKIILDSGAFEFEVIDNKEGVVYTKSVHSGVLKQKKSVNIPGIELDIPTLAQKDIEDISLASRLQVDFVALSYVRTEEDIKIFRQALAKEKVTAHIVAKIETKKALSNLDEIISQADAIMVARGDLGVELPIEEVPFYQKSIIKKCLEIGKPVITATQMLESMIESPKPTRAEVSDVANAIYDHTDALMLSAESAAGKYPVEAVSTLRKVANFTEKKVAKPQNISYNMNHQTAAITYGAYSLLESEFCKKENIKAFVVLTETGMTARMLSRLRPRLPIIALTRKEEVADQLSVAYGVIPRVYSFGTKTLYAKKESGNIREIIDLIKKEKLVSKNDKVIMIYGEDWGTPGKTSVIRIQEVE